MLPLLVGAIAGASGIGLLGTAALGAGTGLLMNQMRDEDERQDPLMSAITGATGAAGVGSLASSLGTMGATAGSVGTAGATTGASNTLGTLGAETLASSMPNPLLAGQVPTTAMSSVANPMLTAQAPTLGQSFQNIGSGIKDLVSEGGWGRFKETLGTPGKPVGDLAAATRIGMPLYSLASSLSPQEQYEQEEERKRNTDLYLYGPKSTPSLQLYANGGSVQQGGLMDLYGTPDSQPTTPGQQYGLARLSNLASEEAMNNAQVGRFAEGGFLQGPGDGVSDNIPAVIEGSEPAKLADGEFVLPSRIVSEIGNGSSKAGAQRLYAMMDRIEKASRNRKNVADDTEAYNYLPA
jgi:hypothetical protein